MGGRKSEEGRGGEGGGIKKYVRSLLVSSFAPFLNITGDDKDVKRMESPITT